MIALSRRAALGFLAVALMAMHPVMTSQSHAQGATALLDVEIRQGVEYVQHDGVALTGPTAAVQPDLRSIACGVRP